MVEKLTSITKSTYIAEGLGVLRTAQSEDINNVKQLKEKIIINQNSDASRKTCWGEIKKRYLSNHENLQKSPLVKIIDFKGNTLNLELMYLNYLYAEPTFYLTMLKLVYPRLESSENLSLSRNDVIGFLSNYLDYSEATLNKTARSIVKALIDFGLAQEGEDNKVDIDFYRPVLISFLYGLYSEYSKAGSKNAKFNILNPSLDHIKEKADFPKLLLLKTSLIEVYLKQAWQEGYLNYEPRGGLNQYVLKYEELNKLLDQLVRKQGVK